MDKKGERGGVFTFQDMGFPCGNNFLTVRFSGNGPVNMDTDPENNDKP